MLRRDQLCELIYVNAVAIGWRVESIWNTVGALANIGARVTTPRSGGGQQFELGSPAPYHALCLIPTVLASSVFAAHDHDCTIDFDDARCTRT